MGEGGFNSEDKTKENIINRFNELKKQMLQKNE
jgi:hypothetical protein